MPDRDDHEREILDLQEEIKQLKQTLGTHAVLDQAVGVVITYGGIEPSQGWAALTEVSQQTHVKLQEVAAYVVQWPQSLQLPAHILSALDTALERQRSSPSMAQHPPRDR
ncbi:ANTAR domain-containing protein [Streptomyces sp. NPDC052301]|uniref:ANTAR domain-containing protein n=1 Tax=Streptomyces sp. NPDC052301 TaxID=3365687 RepID=UPI0037CF02CB